MKIILITSILLLVTGCSTFGKDPVAPKTVIEYREIKVPVPKTPMPPNTDCPQTELEVISVADAENDGTLAKAYRIAIAQLHDCSDLRQKVLDKYREIAAEDAEAIKNIPAATANPNGPFGASGPTADDAVLGPNGGSDDGLPGEELIRQLRINDAFGDLEEEFGDLENKDYDIE